MVFFQHLNLHCIAYSRLNFSSILNCRVVLGPPGLEQGPKGDESIPGLPSSVKGAMGEEGTPGGMGEKASLVPGVTLVNLAPLAFSANPPQVKDSM